jgi:hypothetical protein
MLVVTTTMFSQTEAERLVNDAVCLSSIDQAETYPSTVSSTFTLYLPDTLTVTTKVLDMLERSDTAINGSYDIKFYDWPSLYIVDEELYKSRNSVDGEDYLIISIHTQAFMR